MLERQISFPAIVRSSEASVIKMRQDNYPDLLAFVVMCVKNYLEYCYPNNVGIAAQFAADLIDDRPTWKAADFVNVFRFFRLNPQELNVMGNQITPQKLMECMAIYEDKRAEAMEQFHRENRGKILEQNKHLNPLAEKLALKMKAEGHEVTGDEKLGKQMDAQREKSERIGYGRLATKPQNHQEFFEGK